MAQLGSRVQHALRAYTPNEQKAVRYAAKSFRANPDFDTERAMQELGVGEALVSVLDEKGVPTMVERANILPPRSSMSAVEEEKIAQIIASSPLDNKYKETVDRRSAFEILSEEREQEEKEAEQAKKKEEERKAAAKKPASGKTGRKTQSAFQKTVSSAATSIGRELGRQFIRGILGTFKR